MTRAAFGVLVIACVAGSASASQLFRGFDNNLTGEVPMASTPNSDAARADYLSALSAPVSNDLESLANGGAPAVVEFDGGLSMTASGAAFQVRDTQLNSAYGTQGPRYLYTEGAEDVELLRLTFSSPISALGFTFTDASDWFNTGQNPPHLMFGIELAPGITSYSSLITGYNTSDIRNGSTGFLGVITDSPFTTVIIWRPIGGGDTDAVGFDGFIVPAPGAAGLGLMGMAAAVRRRR